MAIVIVVTNITFIIIAIIAIITAFIYTAFFHK